MSASGSLLLKSKTDRNAVSYPESITHKRGTRTLYSFDYVYSVDGNMVEKHDDEGRSTYYTYDGMNRLIEEVEELDGDVVQTYEYEFDDFSNRTELYAYGDEDYTVNYWYDANDRLLESGKGDGSTETVTEYSYDDNGNRVEKEVWIDNSFDSSETSVYKMEQPSGLPEGCRYTEQGTAVEVAFCGSSLFCKM